MPSDLTGVHSHRQKYREPEVRVVKGARGRALYWARCETGDLNHGSVRKRKATMRYEDHQGYAMKVTRVGTILSFIDSDTGKIQKDYLFVGTLPYCGSSSPEAFLRVDSET